MDIYGGYALVLDKLLNQMLEYFRKKIKFTKSKPGTVFMNT